MEKESITLSELMAVAREAQGSNYVKGDGMLCDKRFEKETVHMIEFVILEMETGLGKSGEYHRRFLTEEDYRKARTWERQKKIRIKRYAKVRGHTLAYSSVPDSKPLDL